MAHLELNNICKAFPGVKALDRVTLTVIPGEIHALCGENGAGKSTLMNILVGNLQPDRGTISIDGKSVTIEKPQHAFDHRISIVYQHLSLVDNLSVAENIFANQQPTNAFGFIQFGELYRQTDELLAALHLGAIDPRTRVAGLSPAQKQMVEIAKALAKDPSIFVLDEPTASLAENETRTLFRILRKLKSKGVSIIYISHRLQEIFELADRVSVLKDGIYQGTYPRHSLTEQALIKTMVGREISSIKSESFVQDEILLSVEGLTGRRFNNINFNLYRGEILGLAGLVGAGRTEIARAIFGADRITSGTVGLRQTGFDVSHPAESIYHGMAYVPEERKRLGLFPEMTIQDNIILGELISNRQQGFYNPTRSKQLTTDAMERLKISAPGLRQKVINLSGGNQQKVVLAKWLLTQPDVLIVDEPTHGIDVGAKFEIYEILKSMAREGKGIILISSDLPEILGIADRILVINSGTVAGELTHAEATEEKIMAMASN
jgi:ribose transport system ATP-binding protein